MEADRQYNWDDLEVGRYDLNHSEKFFAHKHLKHEKFSEINQDLLDLMDEMDLNNVESTTNKENSHGKKRKGMSSLENICRKVLENDRMCRDPKAAPRNLMRQPLASKNTHLHHPAHSAQAVPSVVKYKEIYEKKRQNMIQRMLEEEKKKRMFKSKPAPKFSNEPKVRKPVEALKSNTIPLTPLVLKHSKEAEEKRRKQVEEYMKNNEPPKFVSRNPHVLYEEPFKPQKADLHVEPQPFNLLSEKRSEERKQFDIQIKQKTEEKKRQEEYERKKHEENLIKEIRKMTTFKARPNPFK